MEQDRTSCRKILLLIGCILYFLANFQRVGIPGTVFDDLQHATGLSALGVTLFGALFMYPYSIMQLVVGMLIEKFGGRRSVAYGAMLFAFGCLLFPLTTWTPCMYAARFLSGVGASTIYLSIINEGRTLFPQKVAQVSGLIIMIGYLGGVVAGSPFSSLSGAFGVRNVLLAAGVATVILAALQFTVYTRSDVEPVRAGRIGFGCYREVVRLPLNWYLIGSYAMSFGIFYSLVTVMGKKFLQDVGGFQSVNAAYVFSGVVFMSAVGSMIQGWCGSHFGKKRRIFFLLSTLFALLTEIVSLLTAGNIAPFWLPAVFFVLLAYFNSVGAVAVALMMEGNPQGKGALAIGFSNFMAYVIVAIFGNASGMILDCFTPVENAQGSLVYPPCAYSVIFGILICFTLIGVYCAFKLPKDQKSVHRPEAGTPAS